MGNQSLKNTTTKLIKKNIESHLLFLWICCSSPLLHLQGQHQGLLGFHPSIHRFVPRPHPRIILEPSSRAEVETSMSWMKMGKRGWPSSNKKCFQKRHAHHPTCESRAFWQSSLFITSNTPDPKVIQIRRPPADLQKTLSNGT